MIKLTKKHEGQQIVIVDQSSYRRGIDRTPRWATVNSVKRKYVTIGRTEYSIATPEVHADHDWGFYQRKDWSTEVIQVFKNMEDAENYTRRIEALNYITSSLSTHYFISKSGLSTETLIDLANKIKSGELV